jgi:hypothetical protein
MAEPQRSPEDDSLASLVYVLAALLAGIVAGPVGYAAAQLSVYEWDRRDLPMEEEWPRSRALPEPDMIDSLTTGVFCSPCIASGKPAQPDFRDAYQTQLVLDAILDSAKERSWRQV